MLLLVAAGMRGAWADECSCGTGGGNFTRTSQSGRGMCLTAETGGSCSVQALQGPGAAAPAAGVAAARASLEAAGIKAKPEAAFVTAMRDPPEAWPKAELDGMLSALFALGMGQAGAAAVGDLAKALDLDREAVWTGFTGELYKKQARRGQVGPFAATISYGCIELARAGFHARVRTPFAAAHAGCGDLP